MTKGTNGSTQQEALQSWTEREIRPLLKGRALNAPVELLTLSETLDAWCLLDHVEKQIKVRKEQLRDPLLAYAQAKGKETEKGTQIAKLEGTRIERQRRESGEPNREKFLALLVEKELKPVEAYDEVKQLVFNPSKAKHLVEVGKLVSEEISQLKSVSYALKITKSSTVEAILAGSYEEKSEKKQTTRRRAKQ